MQPFTVAAVAAAAVTAPYQTPQAVDTEAPCKGEIPGVHDFYVGKIPGHNVITDGVYYAHCRNIRDGIRDLQFKRAKDRGVRQYRGIGLDDVIPTDELVTMYRAITGACQQGTEEFLSSLGELKTEYTIREAIELTKGQYGAITFRAFFVG